MDNTKPSYYKKNIEVFDFIENYELHFNIGNVVKYMSRYQSKNGVEDLKKAKVYLEREINNLENHNINTTQ